MNYKSNVFNIVSSAIRNKFGKDTYIAAERVYAPSRFPCVWIVEMDAYPEQRYTAIDFSDEQARSVFEVQVFSNLKNGAMSQAEKMMDCAEKAFRSLGYRMTSCSTVDNAADFSIKRKAARFTRIIGGGDDINVLN